MLLQDLTGRSLKKMSFGKKELPEVDAELSIGGMTVYIDSLITKRDFLAGKPFLGLGACVTTTAAASTATGSITATRAGEDAADETSSRLEKRKRVIEDSGDGESEKHARLSFKQRMKQTKLEEQQAKNRAHMPAFVSVKATKATFKAPLLSNTVLPKAIGPSDIPQPRHDPKADGALVMKRPSSVPKGRRIVDVVLDPVLTKHLREHQREGVAFLYECAMGMRTASGDGAILADEMGLGKTLQTIALLWTLLKQNPIYEEQPVVKKALIVCPATLIKNWRKEIWKWLGRERVGVFVLDNQEKTIRLTDFTKGKAYQIMIIGYEKLRNVSQDEHLRQVVDIVIMDEGHRLKTESNQCAAAIKALKAEKRVILTGTPMQNNLSEYFIMIDLVNPGLLGKHSAFKREFEQPILKSQQPNALSKDIEKGAARAEELKDLTSRFILRRIADVIAKFLPPKTEYVVFLKPEPDQIERYREIVSSRECIASLEKAEALLQLINLLRQLCNSEGLVRTLWKTPETEATPAANSALPRHSTKLLVLDALLKSIREMAPKEKVVIVSNYTSTLDIIQTRLVDYGYLRLDGSTAAAKRQPLVDEFNNTSAERCFAFLLSAKAGGVGLNLIGANRLIMFDIDWNPATDMQAMGRIHRDGQKRPCYIYRFLVMGAMDEKIFQRQISKRGLADSIVDSKASVASFTKDELRDLFSFDESGVCMTHELLSCLCGGTGLLSSTEEPAISGVQTGEMDSSDDDLPDIGTWMKANKLDLEEQERKLAERRLKERGGKAAQMGELMRYQHIDPTKFRAAEDDEIPDDAENAVLPGIENVVEDEVLAKCMQGEVGRPRMAFLLAKKNVREEGN